MDFRIDGVGNNFGPFNELSAANPTGMTSNSAWEALNSRNVTFWLTHDESQPLVLAGPKQLTWLIENAENISIYPQVAPLKSLLGEEDFGYFQTVISDLAIMPGLSNKDICLERLVKEMKDFESARKTPLAQIPQDDRCLELGILCRRPAGQVDLEELKTALTDILLQRNGLIQNFFANPAIRISWLPNITYSELMSAIKDSLTLVREGEDLKIRDAQKDGLATLEKSMDRMAVEEGRTIFQMKLFGKEHQGFKPLTPVLPAGESFQHEDFEFAADIDMKPRAGSDPDSINPLESISATLNKDYSDSLVRIYWHWVDRLRAGFGIKSYSIGSYKNMLDIFKTMDNRFPNFRSLTLEQRNKIMAGIYSR